MPFMRQGVYVDDVGQLTTRTSRHAVLKQALRAAFGFVIAARELKLAISEKSVALASDD